MLSSPIQWREELATGVADIDDQHRTLLNIMAGAEEKIALGFDTSQFESITRDLLAYAIYHFDTEESLIAESGYNEAEPDDAKFHIQEHRRFMAEIIELRNDGGSGEAVLAFLKHWLVNHILSTDKRLGLFLTRK